jgi:nucleobase:cation symporter-1, NCS1 family
MAEDTRSLVARADHESLYGTIPLLRRERVYGFWDLFFVAGSFAVATWCYVQGATLATVVNFWQAFAATLGPLMAAGIIVVLVGNISTRYGIDHWIYQRAVFGYFGVLVLAFVAITTTWGWYAINAQLFGQAMQKGLNEVGMNVTDGWVKPLALGCVVIGWALAMGGPAGVKWSTRIMAPLLFAIGLMVLVLVIVKGHSTIFSAGPIGSEPGTSGSIDNYALAVEWNVAFALGWYPTIGAITRLVKRERPAHWALWLGYQFCMVFFILIAVATALIMAPLLEGGLSTDPTDYLLELGGPWLGTLSVFAIALANITTMVVAVYALSVATKIVRPSLNYRLVGTFWAIWCGVLTAWGGIWDFYPKFLAVIGLIAGPALALILADYYFVRRRRISLRSLYDLKKGSYKYTYGFNIPALIAFGVGVGAFLLVYDPFNYVIRSSLFHYTTATGLSALVAAVFYVLEAQIPAVKRYLTVDATEPAVSVLEEEAAQGALAATQAEAGGA